MDTIYTSQFVEGAEGPQLVDFNVDNGNQRMAAIEDLNANQESWVHTDEYGQQTHELALNNPEVSQYIENDYAPELLKRLSLIQMI